MQYIIYIFIGLVFIAVLQIFLFNLSYKKFPESYLDPKGYKVDVQKITARNYIIRRINVCPDSIITDKKSI